MGANITLPLLKLTVNIFSKAKNTLLFRSITDQSKFW